MIDKTIEMKNLIYFLIPVFLFSCKKEKEVALPAPTNVSNVTVQPRVGGAVLHFNVPADSNYTYLEVSYDRDGIKRITNVSRYTDSVLITGLLNKQEYVFTIQPVNRVGESIVKGAELKSPPVRPIRRADEVTYFLDQYQKVPITEDLLETYTQERTEGPKSNLVDGNIATYWHTAWSSGVAPLPHWIKVSLPEDKSVGMIRYWFRQNAVLMGRPTQIALETSTDGNTWDRVFTSAAGLPTDNPATAKVLFFGKNFTSKYFRVMFLTTPNNATYITLGEIEFDYVPNEIVDKEKEAEANYSDPWL